MGIYMLVESFQWHIGLLLIGNFIDGCLGHHQCLAGATYLYVSDNGSIKNRMFRFVILQAIKSIASASGNFLTGYMIASLSWFYCFLVAGGGFLLTGLWVIIFLPEKATLFTQNREAKETCSWLTDPIKAFKVLFLIFKVMYLDLSTLLHIIQPTVFQPST